MAAITATAKTGSGADGLGRRLYHGCIPEHFFRSRFEYMRAHFGWPRAATAELVELGAMSVRAAVRAARRRANDDLLTRLEGPVFGRALWESRP